MKRVAPVLTALVLSASCAATGIVARGGDPESAPPANEREINRSEFRLRWPFVMGTVTLACDTGAIIVRTAGATYGLDEAALTRGFQPATPILLQQRVPPTNPLGRLTQREREQIFSATLRCDPYGTSDACRSHIRGQYQLSEADLDQILVEGRERHWPPLEPKRVSVSAIVDAGMQLCAQ